MRNFCVFMMSMMLLAACAPSPIVTRTPSPTSSYLGTASPPPEINLHTPPGPTQTVDALINIVEASDPASGLYDPHSHAYEDFPLALPELAKLNSLENSAANELAYAIGFPRPDSTLAATALLSLGPKWAGPQLPTLLDHLKNQRPEVRVYSLIVIMTAGPDGSCALRDIGPLLWDNDPRVRTAAALAAQSLSGRGLVASTYAIDTGRLSPTPVSPDVPEGKIVSDARTWWTTAGSKVNWRPRYGSCDP